VDRGHDRPDNVTTPCTTPRSERLGEVERLSRKPHAELHAKLLDFVLGSLTRLTDDEWMTLARKSPDRLLQALSMSGRLAGYSQKNEFKVEGSGLAVLASKLAQMSDAEIEAEYEKLNAAKLRPGTQ
jgi:hypothetical protein